MKFKTMMIIKALVCLGFGIPILFFPAFLYGLFGIHPTGVGALYPAQEYSAAMLGILFLCWIGRNIEPSLGRKAISWAMLVYNGIGFVITLILVLSGTVSPLLWGIVAVYLLLALGFGYFVLNPSAP